MLRASGLCHTDLTSFPRQRRSGTNRGSLLGCEKARDGAPGAPGARKALGRLAQDASVTESESWLERLEIRISPRDAPLGIRGVVSASGPSSDSRSGDSQHESGRSPSRGCYRGLQGGLTLDETPDLKLVLQEERQASQAGVMSCRLISASLGIRTNWESTTTVASRAWAVRAAGSSIRRYEAQWIINRKKDVASRPLQVRCRQEGFTSDPAFSPASLWQR